MAENQESVRDELSYLAEICEVLDKSEHLKKGFTGLIELELEDYQKFQSLFREIDKGKNKFVVEISDYSFTFVLKK
jgi:predicted AAA+ superfamily ATPase